MKTLAWLWVGLALTLWGCKTDDVPAPRRAIGASLTEGLMFPNAMLLNDGFPRTTDPNVVLFPLGPAVIVEPDGVGIMALEVQDDEGRDIVATLMQFEDDARYLRIPAQEGQGASIIENDFVAAGNLCDGLCNVVFTVEVVEAVELEDGEISATATREILVDCRDQGSASACEKQPGEFGSGGGSDLVCGNVAAGELALSGDPVIDSHFDAALTLGAALDALEAAKLDALAAMAMELAIAKDSSADAVASELDAVIAQNTEAGLSLLLGEQGCGVRKARVEHALRACDPDNVASLATLECTGICHPGADLDACTSAASSGCRGVVSDSACGGTCQGACEVMLAVPAACGGTCEGTCDAECPDDGSGDCLGPCAGLCTGVCRAPSDGVCSGRCFGLCDDPMSGTPSCSPPLEGYCVAATGAATACPGDCFGDADVAQGSALCRQSAIAIGNILPRCEAPVVQLSFSFQAGVGAAAQTDFSMLVQSLNDQLGSLYALLVRADLMTTAAMALSDAAGGPLPDRIDMLLQAAPNDSGLMCVQDALPDLTSWLGDLTTRLQDLRTTVLQVTGNVATP